MKTLKDKTLIIAACLVLPLALSACGSKKDATPTATTTATTVTAQQVANSLTIKRELAYPGTVVSESEAVVVAKTAGTVSNFNVKAGDQVAMSQQLGQINDVSGSKSSPTAFNATQVKQAQIAVTQAQTAYQLALTNYNNLLVSSAKDIKAAEISRDQALKGQTNLNSTTAEALKSAQLAYDTSKIATEQARLNLENRKKQSAQSASDVQDNIATAADGADNSAGAMINAINNMLALDDNGTVSINYRTNLGALDSTAYQKTKDAYLKTKTEYDSYNAASFANQSDKLNAAGSLADSTKTLVDEAKYLLEKSISSASLPQTSATGASLSGFQQTVAGYQTQMNSVIASIKSAKQSLANVGLTNDSNLDSLQKAYELAQQQEAAAVQSLNSLKAGNTSQKDQAGFSASLAQNQYDNLQVKSASQIAAARSQVETAQLQYTNAQVSLQSLFDIHSLISPIAGTVTRKLADNGDTVTAGQTVAMVSQTDKLKIQFYIEAEQLTNIVPGMAVQVVTSDNQSYDGVIASVSQQPDPASHRFLAELTLANNQTGLVIGTVVNVKVTVSATVAPNSGLILLPLSALSIGENATTVFIDDNGIAKKSPVTVGAVVGEYAQVKTTLAPDAWIIIDGNKMLQEGQAVTATTTPLVQ